jgi:hypothetical protein
MTTKYINPKTLFKKLAPYLIVADVESNKPNNPFSFYYEGIAYGIEYAVAVVASNRKPDCVAHNSLAEKAFHEIKDKDLEIMITYLNRIHRIGAFRDDPPLNGCGKEYRMPNFRSNQDKELFKQGIKYACNKAFHMREHLSKRTFFGFTLPC